MKCISAKCLVLTFSILVLSCSTDKEEVDSLLGYTAGKELVLDNVISCAASNEDDKVVSVFLYPRSGASDIRYFETASVEVDKNNFENYTSVAAPLIDVFNGYLLKFELAVEQEKWAIVSFRENGKLHLSNPIRLKHNNKPTEYLPQNVSLEQAVNAMPIFTWQDGVYDDTKIYFQVVSTAQNNLLSGTYTFDKRFQYYQLDNVVLNITENTPPMLDESDTYTFTLLAVSEDNWVNLFSEINFDLNTSGAQ